MMINGELNNIITTVLFITMAVMRWHYQYSASYDNNGDPDNDDRNSEHYYDKLGKALTRIGEYWYLQK